MINIIQQFTSLNYKIIRKFASFDPYYILGVDRRADYNDIKKTYYKLAAEFHPDHNKSPDAAKQFILIKEAFEQIKQLKGKSIKMDLERGPGSSYSSDFKSVRPNASDYTEDYKEQDRMNKEDYKEYANKTPEGEEFDKFRDSLNTIHDINDIKFKPSDIELPDPSKRFDLDSKRVFIKNFSDKSYLFLAVVIALFGLGFYFINQTHTRMAVSRFESLIYNMLNKEDFNEELEKDPDILADVSVDLKKRKEYQVFIKKMEQKSKIQENIRDNSVPIIKKFVSSDSIKQLADESA